MRILTTSASAVSPSFDSVAEPLGNRMPDGSFSVIWPLRNTTWSLPVSTSARNLSCSALYAAIRFSAAVLLAAQLGELLLGRRLLALHLAELFIGRGFLALQLAELGLFVLGRLVELAQLALELVDLDRRASSRSSACFLFAVSSSVVSSLFWASALSYVDCFTQPAIASARATTCAWLNPSWR